MDKYHISNGSHAHPDEGMCAMEWVAHLAGEPHSDHPTCVDDCVRYVCISLNDRLDNTERQKLRPYLARTIGTATDGLGPMRRALLESHNAGSVTAYSTHQEYVKGLWKLLDLMLPLEHIDGVVPLPAPYREAPVLPTPPLRGPEWTAPFVAALKAELDKPLYPTGVLALVR